MIAEVSRRPRAMVRLLVCGVPVGRPVFPTDSRGLADMRDLCDHINHQYKLGVRASRKAREAKGTKR